MNGRRAWAPILVLIGMACLMPIMALAAEFEGTGDEMQISTLDAVLATAWNYLNGTAGKVLGAGIGIWGFTKLGSGDQRERPLLKIGGGAGIALVPPLITSTYEAAPAASGVLDPLASLFALVRDGFLGFRLVQDPVFSWLLLATVLAMSVLHSRHRRPPELVR